MSKFAKWYPQDEPINYSETIRLQVMRGEIDRAIVKENKSREAKLARQRFLRHMSARHRRLDWRAP